jgi:3-oxoacyl-[acyl-carrier-protein] synthase II
MARFAQLAVAAARQAIDASGLQIGDHNRDDIAVVVNTGGGGIGEVALGEVTRMTKGAERVSPFMVPMMSPSMAACQISIQNGIRGPVITSVAACAAGVQAIVDAQRLIEHGDVDVVIAGGTESAIMPVSFAALANMGALSKRNDDPAGASRPFDADRDGFVFGEAAGVLMVEAAEHAEARGATILAEIAGGALTGDAFHISAPEPSGYGAAQAMRRAVRDAHLEMEQVAYVVAHGTSTPLNDATETKAIRSAFGAHADRLAVSSNKSMIGHTLGAAGAMSSVAAVLAIRDGVMSPTINQEKPDPDCDLDYVPNEARRAALDVTIVNGFGFGGQNAVAVFRRYAG